MQNKGFDIMIYVASIFFCAHIQKIKQSYTENKVLQHGEQDSEKI